MTRAMICVGLNPDEMKYECGKQSKEKRAKQEKTGTMLRANGTTKNIGMGQSRVINPTK